MITSPAEVYHARSARFATERDRLARLSGRLSHARVAAFALLVLAGLFLERQPGPVSFTVLAMTIAAFIALVAAHRRMRRREQWHDRLVEFNEQGLHRLSRSWERLPTRAAPPAAAGHAYAADLDLYGHASLTQILGPVGTAAGQATLDGWLLHRAPPDVVRARQEAVTELAGLHDLRETLALHALRTPGAKRADVQRFLRWAESDGWLRRNVPLRIAAWGLPAATWLLLALHAFGVIGSALWLLPMAASLVVYFTTGARVRKTFDEAFGREPLFEHYPQMLAALARAEFTAPLLRGVRDRIVTAGTPADRRLATLQRLMHRADLRLSSMHLPVFLVTLWDLHVLRDLERWQRDSGRHVRDWLAALGEAEALASMATLAHDEPDWCFPTLEPHGSPLLEAESLGHPLIPAADRVSNDVTVGPPGSFLLVTGSNMSGKSTLLRALGVNAVLAQAGAPCCARRLRMPPLDVHTSIRVQDSLARGVSYFMAELERLKQVVDAAHAARAADQSRLLFLLDEILHGTNTAERRIAARNVIRHLVDTGAIGAATTHDLALAEEPAIAECAQLVHFEEHFVDDDGGSTLRFDYRLRPGLATSTNALALMRLVGLPAE
jgi:hypothetical protein